MTDAATLRRLYPRVVSRMIAFTGSLPDAEDATQDAVTRALSRWPKSGVPDSPEAWLVAVATNVHRDRIRKRRRERPPADALETLAQMSPWARIAVGDPEIARGWRDELLRLLFACCHPSLEAGESAALCLTTIVGLSTREVAAAFVVSARTMEQRLTRARRRLRERGDGDGAPPEGSHDRLDAVLRVIHLLFNEGWWSTTEETAIRAELCRLAIGLAHSLVDAFPDGPEAAGLLALLLFHDARRGARQGASGETIALPEQDRSLWDRAAIERGVLVLRSAVAFSRPGPYQLEAAISAVHCEAARAEDTDWAEIARLYQLLETLHPSPAVRINRAFAVARVDGPSAGLALLEDPAVGSYPYVHLVRGALLAEDGQNEAARTELLEAQRLARNAAERAQIEARLANLS